MVWPRLNVRNLSIVHFIEKSLSWKILVVLTISGAIVMAGVIYLAVRHETEEMLLAMNVNNEETSSAIHAGLKYPMSVGDSNAVEKQLLDIRDMMPNVEVFICDTSQKIIFSTHEDRIKSDLGKYIYNKDALRSLARTLENGEGPREIFEEEVSNHRYLLNIHTIFNQKDCFRCHSSEKKVLGAIVLRESTDRNYAAIGNLRNTNIVVSLLGICAIVAIAYILMAKLIHQPIKNLVDDVRRIPEKIAQDADFEVTGISRTDEIGDLQNSFNKMAIEIKVKNRDIEKSKRKLEAANKELEAFAYSVSHDLRAPLRNIDGFSKILLDEFSENLHEKAKHYLRRVREGTSRMSLLIDDLLTFSRIGRTDLQSRPTNCRAMIKSVLEYYSNEITARKVTVNIGELPVIQCDPTLMQNLFSNLISNALKFLRNVENPEITVGYDHQKNALFVRDNGIGFEMQYHDKIFEVFQRLHLPEEYEGTGIGLAIVKRIAERHKGSIWAESKIGNGATFFINLPGI